MSTEINIEQQFRQKICAQIDLIPEGIDRYVVSVPFTFDDGDEFTIILKKRSGRWILTDEGHTFMHLSYDMDERDWQRGNREVILEEIQNCFDIRDQDGELVLHVPDNRFGDSLFEYLQALTKISDLRFLSREVIKSTFIEDFTGFIESFIPPDERVFEWHDRDHDPAAMYPVDVRINHREIPFFLYAVQGDEKARDVTISLLRFETWGLRYNPVIVFENQERISRKVLTRLMDVSGKMFSTLPANRERIKAFLNQDN